MWLCGCTSIKHKLHTHSLGGSEDPGAVVDQAFEQLQLLVYQALLLCKEIEGLLFWESPGSLHMRAVFKVRSPTHV